MLISVHQDHSLTLQNNAARRLFGAAPVTRLTDLKPFGESFYQSVLEAVPGSRELVDLRDAVSTVARRSNSLVQFVESYRQITRLAPPEKKRLRLHDLFDAVVRLARAEDPDSPLDLNWSVHPPGLDISADRDLLEPVLLNLLRNARQATAAQERPEVRLNGKLNRRGHTTIEVSDNGPGVPDNLARKIFVPFFTTRQGGSGVGLALARQVMIAHRGFIRLDHNEHGGARFTLIF